MDNLSKASIHEQISSIAEKLTKDIEQQVQVRQQLEQEEQDDSNSASAELKVQELYESKEYNPEAFETVQETTVVPSPQDKINRNKSKVKILPNLPKPLHPVVDWDPVKESAESNDASIYKELVQVKQKLEKQYNNQTFPIKLVRKNRI